MIQIGLISDTHSYLNLQVLTTFKNCDEIWHAGDVGNIEVLDQLEGIKPLRAVFGNIDGQDIRSKLPETEIFTLEGVKVFLTHIGGTPPRYSKGILSKLKKEEPKLFICGHSHILKVMTDHNLNNMLYMNPGAAGHHGFHHMRTVLRFKLDKGKIFDLEVVELGKRGRN